MTFEQAINHFGTSRAVAEVLRKSPGRISHFKSAGGFPYEIQCVLEKHSGRVLIAERSDDPHDSSYSKADAA